MQAPIQELVELELQGRFDPVERCVRCRRTLLFGEHVHVYDGERTVCDLCRTFERSSPLCERVVHGAAFGATIRIIDQRDRTDRRASA